MTDPQGLASDPVAADHDLGRAGESALDLPELRYALQRRAAGYLAGRT